MASPAKYLGNCSLRRVPQILLEVLGTSSPQKSEFPSALPSGDISSVSKHWHVKKIGRF